MHMLSSHGHHDNAYKVVPLGKSCHAIAWCNLEARIHGVLHFVVVLIPKLRGHEDVLSLDGAQLNALMREKTRLVVSNLNPMFMLRCRWINT
jgi:hypothetical protein